MGRPFHEHRLESLGHRKMEGQAEETGADTRVRPYGEAQARIDLEQGKFGDGLGVP